MQILKYFVISKQNEVLLEDTYDTAVTEDVLNEYLKIFATLERPPPYKIIGGFHYYTVQRAELSWVAVTKQPSLTHHLLFVLGKIADVIEDICGKVTSDSLHRNRILVEEALQEMISAGFIQVVNPEKVRLQLYAETQQSLNQLAPFMGIKSMSPESRSLSASIFVDCIEKLVALFGTDNSYPTSSSIHGQLRVRASLPPPSQLDVSFTAASTDFIQTLCDGRHGKIHFNDSVTIDNLSEGTISIRPLGGEQNIMMYSMPWRPEIKLPFTLAQECKIENKSITLNLTLVSHFPEHCSAPTVQLLVVFSPTVTKVQNTLTGHVHMKGLFDPDLFQWKWKIHNMVGQSQVTSSLEVTVLELNSFSYSVQMNFEVSDFLSSGLKLKQVKIISSSSPLHYNKWIRYLTSSDAYIYTNRRN